MCYVKVFNTILRMRKSISTILFLSLLFSWNKQAAKEINKQNGTEMGKKNIGSLLALYPKPMTVVGAEVEGKVNWLVVGHTGCGAIQATIEACGCGDSAGGDTACGEGARSDDDRQTDVMAPLTAPIARAIGDERDPYRASERNVRAGMAALASCPQLADLCDREGLRIAGAVYHTHSGVVDFLE